MPFLFKDKAPHLIALLVAITGAVISVALPSRFGAPQLAIFTLASGLPMLSVFLISLRERQDTKESDEKTQVSAKLSQLEGDISKINLALKLRN